jgi:hypothetical protein
MLHLHSQKPTPNPNGKPDYPASHSLKENMMEVKLFVKESSVWQQVQKDFRSIYTALEYVQEHLPEKTRANIQAGPDLGMVKWDDNGFTYAVFK